MRKKRTLSARFWEKVEKGEGADACWEWLASVDKDGYGQIGSGTCPPTMLKAHRVSWELHFKVRLNPTEILCHRCDNPKCVRPSHLFVGTHTVNQHDMTAKGRNVFQHRNPSKKLTDAQVEAIRAARSQGTKLRVLSVQFGVTEGTVSRIAAGVRRPRLK